MSRISAGRKANEGNFCLGRLRVANCLIRLDDDLSRCISFNEDEDDSVMVVRGT